MVVRSPIIRLTVVLLIVLMPAALFAGPVAQRSDHGSSVDWQVSATSYDRVLLTISTPGGDVISREFKSGEPVTFNVKELASIEDGAYNYQLTVVPRIPERVSKQLKVARAAGDDAAARAIMRGAGIGDAAIESGSFQISGGSIVSGNLTERSGPGNIAPNAAAPRPITPTPLDQVIPDDLIVQGSACVGLDCVNNENFGFDTIRMKENNTRVHFDDTSTQAGFPANDWRLIANDSASGGSSKFSIEDSTGAKTPFTLTAGASTNSIFVDSTGRVGFRTSTPVLDLHVNTSNTPAIRLEQNNSGGFTAQTWDIGANEANFFVRDVTGGSRLSLRIRPGAPTSSIDISADGDVGIGTGSPDAKLTVIGGNLSQVRNEMSNWLANNVTGGEVDFTSNAFFDTAWKYRLADEASRYMQINGTHAWQRAAAGAANGAITWLNVMSSDASGNVTVAGNFTVTGTKNFATPDPADSKKALYYTALEGPEAGTYFRGTAKTVDGSVVIELPGYFSRLTESARMTVQVTPVGSYGQIYVASKTPEKLVIKVAEGTPDLEFDYFVQGIRKGYLDYEIERPNNLPNQ